MATSKEQKALDVITEFYLKSQDFNGIPFRTLNNELGDNGLVKILITLLENDNVSIVFGDRHPNPHIKALKCEPIEEQIEKAISEKIHDSCVYPSQSHLNKLIDINDYPNKPYTLKLALGHPQLDFGSFDLSVLEYYRNDPRYYYQNDDVRGHIYVKDEYYQSDKMPKSDKILVDHFGFSYDENRNRAVAVFLVYLSKLSPEHQQIWKAKELIDDYELHPDYYKNTILGDWGDGISIFSALIEELNIINMMSDAMGRPSLFRTDFSDRNKPKKFTFLIRPTLSEFNDFISLLDKILSENISKKFFMNNISYENETPRDDGKIVVVHKGTITILEDWLKKYYRPSNVDDSFDVIIGPFKKVRKLRQNPAHAINEDKFDQQYLHQQREIMIEAYDAIRTLRSILEIDPKVIQANIIIPSILREGNIWIY